MVFKRNLNTKTNCIDKNITFNILFTGATNVGPDTASEIYRIGSKGTGIISDI